MEICPICDSAFTKSVWNQKFCSNKCKRSIKVNCSNCNKEVIRQKGRRRYYYCSRRCSDLFNGRSVERSCKQCRKKFTVKKSAIEKGWGSYCSVNCHNESMKITKLGCCRTCGEVYEITEGSKELYCSRLCAHEGYRNKIDKNQLIELYVEKELTSREVGDIVGRDKKVVIDYLRYYGIEVRPDGIKSREPIKCNDGHKVRSYYERAFDDYLYKLGIEHEYDVRLPFDKRYMADFKVDNVYVEIWGMMGWKPYEERRKRKLKLYRENNCTLLEVFPEDFKQLEKKMNELKRLIS